jgi:hypothetical protein
MSFINGHTTDPSDVPTQIGYFYTTKTNVSYTNGIDSATGSDYSMDNYTVPIGVWLISVNFYAQLNTFGNWLVGTTANMYFNGVVCNTIYYQEFPDTYYNGVVLSGYTKFTALLNTTVYSSGASGNTIKVYPNITTYNGTVTFTGTLYVTYTKIA